MGHDKRLRSAYEEILNALEEALVWLEQPPAKHSDANDLQRSAMFHLGRAGGLAFFGRLPGIRSEGLFDDISDAAENRDLTQIGRIRRAVAAKLKSDDSPDEFFFAKGGLDWAVGPSQIFAVLKETCTAQEEGNAARYSLMAGFLVGLISEWQARYQHGSLTDAVLAAFDRNPESARIWVKAESIRAWEWKGQSVATDPRVLLLEWVEARLAAANRLSGPVFLRRVGETEDERRDREAREKAYFDREETSIQRAQDFGKRITGPDGSGL